MSDTERVLVVIPTYNEVKSIEPVVERVRRAVPDVEVLVVDDNSPDGTGRVADDISARDNKVHVLHRSAKQGLGAAYREGFGWALDRDYDVVVEMDADGSHLPEQLPRLLSALADADLVLGARWVPGGRTVNWSSARRLLSRSGNLYVRAALGLGLHDATGGFRAFRRQTLAGLDLAAVSSQGYCFQVDVARRAAAGGRRVVEVPITFVEREEGESKMSRDIVREALVSVTVWGVRHRAAQLGRLVSARRRS